jgi:hypothetical protein
MDRPLVWQTADNSAVDDRSGSSREPANLIAELRQPPVTSVADDVHKFVEMQDIYAREEMAACAAR